MKAFTAPTMESISLRNADVIVTSTGYTPDPEQNEIGGSTCELE